MPSNVFGMRRRSWKVWVAGIALVQSLVIGVDIALLWPTPTEADRMAAMIHKGMAMSFVAEMEEMQPVGWATRDASGRGLSRFSARNFGDGSCILVLYDQDSRVASVATGPTDAPLTRLHRTLARVLPLLGE